MYVNFHDHAGKQRRKQKNIKANIFHESKDTVKKVKRDLRDTTVWFANRVFANRVFDQGLPARTYKRFLQPYDKNLALKMGRGFEATFPRDPEKSCGKLLSRSVREMQSAPAHPAGWLPGPGAGETWSPTSLGERGIAQLLWETVRWLPRSYGRTTVRIQQFHPRYVLFTSTHPHVLSRAAHSSQLVESSQVSINE